MELTWWWLGIPVLLAICGIAAYRWRGALRGRGADDGLLAANTKRLRESARYRELAARQLRWLTIQLACLALATLGGVLLTARLAKVTVTSPDLRNRDIILCLDVSGSMRDVDGLIARAYRDLSENFKTERISLVIWDSSPVMVFPLTTDYSYVATELERAEKAFHDFDYYYVGGTHEGSGSSLIGEGLVSCLNRFDQRDVERPRTVILATDNYVSGESLYTLPEAAELAIARKVMVYAITPTTYENKETAELREQARRTGGDLMVLNARGGGPDPRSIVEAVERQEKKVFKAAPTRSTRDFPMAGGLLAGLGVLGAIVAGRRLRA